MKFFNTQVRTYIATNGTDDFLKENEHEDDLSYDKFTDDAESDEYRSSFEPAQTESLEDTVLLGNIIKDLIKEVSEINSQVWENHHSSFKESQKGRYSEGA
jgi:hypothetical protein